MRTVLRSWFVTALVLGVAVGQHSKPTVTLDFSAMIDVYSHTVHFDPPRYPSLTNRTEHYNMSLAASVDGQKPGFMSYTWTLPFLKYDGEWTDCVGLESASVRGPHVMSPVWLRVGQLWQFFDENVCWKWKMQGSQQECATDILKDMSMTLLRTVQYESAKFNRTETFQGQTVQVYGTWMETNNSNSHGYDYSLQDIEFWVTSDGHLLKFVQKRTSMEVGENGPTMIIIDDETDIFTSYTSPAAPSTYALPTNCIDLGVVDSHPVRFPRNGKLGPHQIWMDRAMYDANEIAAVNKANLGWVAGENAFMSGRSLGEASLLLDTFAARSGITGRTVLSEEEVRAIPSSFDARKQWANCSSVIGNIRDQGDCGSCWAFGATEAFEDRVCIKSGGAQQLTLSPQYMVRCDDRDDGCGGGYTDSAWEFLIRGGECTEECLPYGTAMSSPCPTKCKDNSTISKLYKGKTAYAVSKPGDVAKIQQEIMTNGPIEVAFFVYSDFMSYKGGVYKKSANAQGPLGGHAVKFLGWGEDNGTPYWLVANSWGAAWGEQGFFRIIRGTDECGIESLPTAGEPEL